MNKSKPILFSSEMVKAILEGRKTQTRRILTDPGILDILEQDGIIKDIESFCPFGTVGEKLWVRESHQLYINWNYDTHSFNQVYVSFEHQEGFYCWDYSEISYQTSLKLDNRIAAFNKWKSCPSIHLYQEFARIELTIKSVRVERLNYISKEDCIAEGIESKDFAGKIDLDSAFPTVAYKIYGKNKSVKWDSNPYISFYHLWESIHGKDSWDKNPWVWVIEFDWKLIEKEVQGEG